MCCCAHRVWQLQLVAALHSQQAVRDVAWSPFDPCQAAFICQGGSLHTLQVADRPNTASRLHVQVSGEKTVTDQYLHVYIQHA